jgi:hypothetical protein
MAFDSSGAFSRLYTWADDRDADVKIRADRMDSEFDNFKGGLDLCFIRDGRAAATGHWSMGGFRISQLAEGTANGHAVRFEQLTALSAVYQPLDVSLTGIGGLTWVANKTVYGTGPDTFALCDLTAYGRGLIAAANNAAFLTAAGLGSAANAAIGTSGDALGKLNTANTYSGRITQTGGELRNADNSAFYSWFNGANTTRSGYMQLTSAGVGILTNEIAGGTWNFSAAGAITANGSVIVTAANVSTYAVALTGAQTVTGRKLLAGDSARAAPTLGSAHGSVQISQSGDLNYGVLIGCANDGSGWIQSQHVGGSSTAYNLLLQPSGGDVILPDVAASSVFSAGYRGVPLMGGAAVNAARTFSAADSGKCAYHDEVTARTWTIDSNANLALPIGTVFVIDNTGNGGAAGAITLAITTDTLRRGDGSAGTGSRTVGAGQVCAVRKVKSTEWVITGTFT